VEDTVLIDIWDILKAYIPKKELSSAAEQIVNYLNGDTTAQALEQLNHIQQFDDEDDW